MEKNYPYLLIFAPIKDFLDVYNVEQPWPNVKYSETFEILKVSSNFDIYSFCSNFQKFRGFLEVQEMSYVLENKPSTPEKF